MLPASPHRDDPRTAPTDGAGPTDDGWAALRANQREDARTAFVDALTAAELRGDDATCAACHLGLAEVARAEGLPVDADRHVRRARTAAERAGHAHWLARVQVAEGELLLQAGCAVEAIDAFERAVDAEDPRCAGAAWIGLGEARSRARRAGATVALVTGARTLATCGDDDALARAWVRLAQLAHARGQAMLCLAAAALGHRALVPRDPVQGVGQALRWVVKALALAHEWPAAVVVAAHRCRVAGDVQPNAVEVDAFYRERSPPAWARTLARWDDAALADHAARLIAEALAAPMAAGEVPPTTFDGVSGALDFLAAYAAMDDGAATSATPASEGPRRITPADLRSAPTPLTAPPRRPLA